MKKLLLIFTFLAFIGCKEVIDFDDITEVDYIFYIKDDMSLATGTIQSWWDNGQLKFEITVKDGEKDGVHKWWFKNGQLEFEGTYKDGGLDGVIKRWYNNGQLKSERNWKDDEFISEKKY